MIRSAIRVLCVAGLALAAPALAAGPSTTSLCLDVNGRTLPVVCHVTGSRIDQQDLICQCPEGARVDVPICGPGQHPQVESRAFERARKDLAKDGSLIGDSYQGQPICVDPRRP